MQAKAQDQTTGTFLASGMVGLASGQSARLNVVTVGVPSEMAIELMFLDRQGAILARSLERVSPCQAASIIIHYTPLPAVNSYPVRTLVRFNKPSRG